MNEKARAESPPAYSRLRSESKKAMRDSHV